MIVILSQMILDLEQDLELILRPQPSTVALVTSSDSDTPTPSAAGGAHPSELTFPNFPPFTANTGLKFDHERINTPKDIYSLIIMTEQMKHFKSETNKYAGQFKKDIPDWKTVTELKIEGVLLIFIHMSPIYKHEIADYWSTKKILQCLTVTGSSRFYHVFF